VFPHSYRLTSYGGHGEHPLCQHPLILLNGVISGPEDIRESFGVTATADFICVVVKEESQDGVFRFVQRKNRNTDMGDMPVFLVRVDKGTMRFYNFTDEDTHVLQRKIENWTPDQPYHLMGWNNFNKT
jgi:hypothetical protein